MSAYFHSGLDFARSGNGIADLARPSDNVTPNTIRRTRSGKAVRRQGGKGGKVESGKRRIRRFWSASERVGNFTVRAHEKTRTRSPLHVLGGTYVCGNVLVNSCTYIIQLPVYVV